MRTQHHSRSSSGSREEATSVHVPVLLQEVLAQLGLTEGETVLDGTLGGGGHAAAMAAQLGATGTLIGIDTDSVALTRAKCALKETPCTVKMFQNNFRNIDTVLKEAGVTTLDAALFDLGLSSDQLEVSGRGFTFRSDEPLVMTLSDRATDLTAAEVVNEWAEESLADIIFGYGGERYARRIAKAITDAREHEPISTATHLAELVKAAVPAHARFGRIHPATKTFQAIRIAVNDELGAVEELLNKFPAYAKQGTRLAVITFHSLEDRIIKRTFKRWQEGGKGAPTTKKPIAPTQEEIAQNPRARSSKLRVFTFN